MTQSQRSLDLTKTLFMQEAKYTFGLEEIIVFGDEELGTWLDSSGVNIIEKWAGGG